MCGMVGLGDKPMASFDVPAKSLKELRAGDMITVQVKGKVRSINAGEEGSDYNKPHFSLEIESVKLPGEKNQIQKFHEELMEAESAS